MPDPKAPAAIAWTRVYQACDRLFDALEALDEAGGITTAEQAAGWTPTARARAVETLKAAKNALDGHLAASKASPRQ